MKLCDVISTLSCDTVNLDSGFEVSDIVYDSRKAASDNVFVCMVGAEVDGHKYIKGAYEKGCRAFVVQRDHADDLDIPKDAAVVITDNTRSALAKMSDVFFGHPSGDIKVIGITGTKGKTSITYIIQSVLNACGIETGLIGTAGATWKDKKVATVNTTPESYETQKLLRAMADDGVKAVAIEVSSLGVKWHRVEDVEFFCGVFTNISPDHIGGHEHESYEEYYSFKKAFFDLCTQAVACGDDPASKDMLEKVKGRTIFYGFNEDNELCAKNAVPTKYDDFMGIKFDLFRNGSLEGSPEISLPGVFSAQNALATIAVCELMGISSEEASKGLRNVRAPGRAQIVYMSDEFGIIIDYAHNGLSLESIIETVKAYEPKRVISLFGSVGDRAQLRREELGTVSAKMSDFTIITSDDPNYENPDSICDEIEDFYKKAGGDPNACIKIPDREAAVSYAVAMLDKGDMLLCCGKGHEKFMKVKGQKLPFDEEAIIKESLKERGITL